MFGLDTNVAAVLSAVLGVIVFVSHKAMDAVTKYLGILMLLLIGYVTIASAPPVGTALKHSVLPLKYEWLATITLLGGTVGGYITFSGGHRLIDAGIVGEENLS